MKKAAGRLSWLFLLAIPFQSCLTDSDSNENIILSGIVQEKKTYNPMADIEVTINDSFTAKTDSKGSYTVKLKVPSAEFSTYENRTFKMKLKLERDTLVDLTIQYVDTSFAGKNPVKKHIGFGYVDI